ncbi:MAG: hypothetical protein K0R65_281 [Crocinitomicaceae bacterium]|jgi:hypothetical protein|nr:hypothetical protein [Crocinitomicaceae bacterium]
MQILPHPAGSDIPSIAEVRSDGPLISNAEDGLDLLGTLYFQGFDKIVLYTENICPEFFELKNGMAGEILQKFSNFRVRLAIVGDFQTIESKSLRDFIYESNQGKSVCFVESLEKALEKLN